MAVVIYLAGPIDDVSRHAATSWYDRVDRIAPADCVLITPASCMRGGAPVTADAVSRVCRTLITCSDGVLANLAGEGRGFGTIREVEFAKQQKKPVAVIYGSRELVSAFAYDVIKRETLEAAFEALITSIERAREQRR